jgi:hypothetical protein
MRTTTIIDIDLEPMAVTDYSRSSPLKRDLHMFTRSRSDVIPQGPLLPSSILAACLAAPFDPLRVRSTLLTRCTNQALSAFCYEESLRRLLQAINHSGGNVLEDGRPFLVGFPILSCSVESQPKPQHLYQARLLVLWPSRA